MRTTYLDYNASTPIDPGVADAMRPLLAEAPIGLVGHSVGSMIAAEAASRLGRFVRRPFLDRGELDRTAISNATGTNRQTNTPE